MVTAQLGLTRLDVAAAFPHLPEASAAGWTAEVDLGDFDGKQTTIAAYVLRSTGEWAFLGLTSVVIEGGDLHASIRSQLRKLSTRYLGALADRRAPEGNLDTPRQQEVVAEGSITVSGWVLDPLGTPETVLVTVGGEPRGPARLGLPRSDVAAAFGDSPLARKSGWATEVDLRGFAGEQCEIGAHILRASGEWLVLARRQVHVSRVTPPIMAGTIDFPAPGDVVERSALTIRGWALAESGPVVRVEVSLNDAPAGLARLGLPRPDVGAGHVRPEASLCGFEHSVDLTEFPASTEKVSLSVVAHGSGGQRIAIGDLELRLERAQPPFADANGRVASLRDRVTRLAAPQPDKVGPVNLLAFTHSLGYGGGQLYLFELLRRLVAQTGFRCTVIVPDDGPLRGPLEDLGIEVHVSGWMPVHTPDAYEGRMQELAAWASAQQFNLVLANTVGVFPGIDLASRMALPSVWAIHESYPLSAWWNLNHPGTAAHPYVRQRLEVALASAAAIIFEADETRRMYQAYGDPARFVTVPYGIDLESIDRFVTEIDRNTVRRRLGLPDDATVLLCLGTVELRKAQTLLAEAFAPLSARFRDAMLVFVGDFPSSYSEGLHDFVRRAGLDYQIRIVPIVPDPYPWYVASDVFVCASDVESLPRSMLEAMGFGLPVLATSVFGIPDLITDGQSGFLCEPRDTAALAAALERVLGMRAEDRLAVGAAGADLVRRRHDGSNYASSYSRLFEHLLHDPHALPAGVLREP